MSWLRCTVRLLGSMGVVSVSGQIRHDYVEIHCIIKSETFDTKMNKELFFSVTLTFVWLQIM